MVNSWCSWAPRDVTDTGDAGIGIRHLEVAKILEHIVEQTLREPPLMLTDPVPSFSDLGDTNFQYPEVPWYPAILPRSNIECCKGICVLSGPFCRFSEEPKAMEIPSSKELHRKPIQKSKTQEEQNPKLSTKR